MVPPWPDSAEEARSGNKVTILALIEERMNCFRFISNLVINAAWSSTSWASRYVKGE